MVSATPGAKLIGQELLLDGQAATTWQYGASTTKVAAARGSIVTITVSADGSSSVSVSPPSWLARASRNPRELQREYASSGMSVYYQALAVGMTPAEAAQMMAQMHLPMPAAVGSLPPQQVPAARAAAPVTPPLESPFNTSCASDSIDGGAPNGGFGHACIAQFDAGANNGKDYVDDEINSTS